MNQPSKIKHSLVMLLAAVLLTTGVTSYAALTREKELVFVYNEQEQNITTKATTVGEVLSENGYQLTDRATLNVPLETEVTDAMRIELTADHTIDFYYMDAYQALNTSAETVAELLEEQGYTVHEDETVIPSMDTKIVDGMAVYIQRTDKVSNTQEEEIAFETEYRLSDDLYVDETRVAQEGENGLRRTEVIDTMYNGRYMGTTTEVTIVKEPVPEIIEEGTMEYPVPEPETEGYTESYTESDTVSTRDTYSQPSYENAGGWMDFTATAYDPSVGDTTRMGTPARLGVIAVDPSVIPLGSTVEVEGYGVFSAEDTGGAINGRKIDIFVSTYNEAIQFGIRNVRVRILD